MKKVFHECQSRGRANAKTVEAELNFETRLKLLTINIMAVHQFKRNKALPRLQGGLEPSIGS